MIPYDGFGFGRSQYWEKQAKEMAQDNGELCECFETKIPSMNIKSEDSNLRTVTIKVILPNCFHSYEMTEMKLSEKFREFYK